jgi:uncharacterized protein (DUF433 family)
MIKTAPNSKLGEGIYSIPDIAFLLRLPKAKVRRWLNDFWDARLAKKYNQKYSWGKGREKATNFYTLIEFYVFYQLRDAGVAVNSIFSAHEEIANQLKTPYPFASAELLTDGKSILYSLEDGTTVKADKTRQIAFKEIIKDFCKKIAFSNNKLAERYYPLGKEQQVIVDPNHQFGQPVIEHTNVLAETIYRMHTAGESNEFLARLYDIPLKNVEAAICLFNNKAA